MLLITRILGFAVCGSMGYFAAQAFQPMLSSKRSETAKQQNGTALPPLTANPAESALVTDWERLRALHGGDGADMDTLYKAVKDEKDAFRRRAYRSALIAEWSVRDPRAALAYLLEKDTWQAGQLAREWMRLDPDAAITGLLAGGPKARNEMRGLLSEIARVAPGRLAEVVAVTPKSDSRWDTSAQDAFAIFAQKDLAAARSAAEAMTGAMRTQVLAGVAKAWAESDGPAALAWAQAIPAGEARDGALKAALVGWAKKDPMTALDHIDVVPPGGEEHYHASDVGAQVLREAGKKDWDATVKWLVDHPGKLGRTSLDGLQGAMYHRLAVDTGGTLRSIEKSGLPGIEHVFGNAVLNDGYTQRDAIWAWLDGQPKTEFTRSIRGSLLNAIGWKEPEVALGFLNKLSDQGEERTVLERAAQSLLNGGQQFHLIDGLLDKASANVRPFLLEAAFNYGGSEHMGADLQKWIKRLDEVAPERRAMATGSVARSWAGTDPKAASEWALQLPEGGGRENAVSNVAATWASQDPRSAATWVNTLPAGTERDSATLAMVNTMGRSEPESAWTWALSIGGGNNRISALQSAYMNLRKKDPNIAQEMLQSANLSADEVKAVQSVPQRVSGGVFYAPF
jgi:hypothetical protein